jgi:hypothetical protein
MYKCRSMTRVFRELLRCETLAFICAGAVAAASAQNSIPPLNDGGDISTLHDSFAHPPDDCRIMVRWWWFGPSATNPELQRELEQMKAAGIGGVEIATLYPLALDDPATGFHNYDFVSDEHLDHLRFAAQEARRLGLRVDVTLGSGWPFGGPSIPATQAAGALRVESVSIAAGAASVAVPALEAGEKLMAVFIAPAAGSNLKDAKALPMPTSARLEISGRTDADRRVLFFISSRTGMMVKRPAAGATGFVLDHYDQAAIENHLHAVGERLLSAFGDHPPYAVFSDSLEDYASDWTPDLLAEFQRRRGYDLAPLLPALVGDFGPDTAAIRHDWGHTLTELANERYLQPIHAWAGQHHTLFRSQTYGFPPVTLSSNRYADLPEGEGKATVKMWRQFSDTRWAASAGHLFGHNVISSETWTWLHSPSFRATPLDMKAEADLHFLQGINQLIGHGWPYSPESAGEPGWRLYAAGAFNGHNPWFPVMPDLTGYLQRVSYAMRLGEPANDVALLLPNDDVWASFVAKIQKPRPPTSTLGFDESGSNVTIDENLPRFLKADVIPQILDAGFNLDFIDADAIDAVGIPYKVLVLPGVDRLPPETYEKILAFAQHGGIVVATRRLPATAPGLSHADEVGARIQALSQTLFHGQIATGHFVPDERNLGAQLAGWLKPDFSRVPATPEIGFIHRRLENGDLYFVANTSNRAQKVQGRFRTEAAHAEMWDAFTGNTSGLPDSTQVELDLQPYESRIIFLSNQPHRPGTLPPRETRQTDISQEWTVSFEGESQPIEMHALTSWPDEPRLRYYSGRATYRKTIDVPAAEVGAGHSVGVDFGEGTPVPSPAFPVEFDMRAYLESPVREAAQVFVNDQLAGYVWHPPFRVNVTPYLKAGKNELRIVVGNTAINELAGTSLPNYRLLYSRYGREFEPQGMRDLQPLPSGILGHVTLIESSPAH